MQQNTEFTLDFMDKALRKLSYNAYDIDDESKIILGIIAKHGPINETQITHLGKRRISLSREIIRRRLLVTDLTDGYVSVAKGKKIGNLKKIERKYSLTFKGLLASLNQTQLRENFWIKNYLNFVETITEKRVSDTFLNHMYYHIILFFIIYSKKQGLLTKHEKPETDFFDDYQPFGGALDGVMDQSAIKGIPVEYRDLFLFSFEKFFTSCNVVAYLVKNLLKVPLSVIADHDDYNQFQEFLTIFFREWMWKIFSVTNKTTTEILNSVNSESEYVDFDEDDVIDLNDEFGDEMWDSFLFSAADEINHIMPESKLDPTDYVNSKSEIDSLIDNS